MGAVDVEVGMLPSQELARTQSHLRRRRERALEEDVVASGQAHPRAAEDIPPEGGRKLEALTRAFA